MPNINPAAVAPILPPPTKETADTDIANAPGMIYGIVQAWFPSICENA